MSLTVQLKRRVPLLVDYAVVTTHFLRRLVRWHPRQAWSEHAPPLATGVPLGDVPVGFFLRLALEGKYESIIEIGTYDGSRISTLRKCAPTLMCHGLDIGPQFQAHFERNGVHFGPFGLDALKNYPKRSLIICVQTLTCLRQEQVLELFSVLADSRHDIAFFEPLPLFDPGAAAPISRERTGQTGNYHDYPRLAKEAGLMMRLVDENRGWPHTAATKTLERVQPFYAVSGDLV